ncbi:MAG: Redox-sensing transcriptional regulator QorR, partial [uncultured Gemmatimonadetes bacterium]
EKHEKDPRQRRPAAIRAPAARRPHGRGVSVARRAEAHHQPVGRAGPGRAAGRHAPLQRAAARHRRRQRADARADAAVAGGRRPGRPRRLRSGAAARGVQPHPAGPRGRRARRCARGMDRDQPSPHRAALGRCRV